MQLPHGAKAGIGLYLLALFLFTALDTTLKFAVATLPVLQVLWARFLFHLVTVSAVLAIAGTRLPPISRAPRLQAARSVILATANLCFTAALAVIPLAETTAIGFLAPVLTVLAAAYWLGEQITPRRIASLLFGFLGVLVVIRPGDAMFQPASLLPLITAGLFAVYQVMTRKLAFIDDSRTTIFHTGLVGSALTTLLLPFVWVTPSLAEWGLLVLAGALGGIGHWFLILAHSRAPAGLLAPFAYTQLAAATLSGFLFFGEVPDSATLLGAGAIAMAGLLALPPREGKPSAV